MQFLIVLAAALACAVAEPQVPGFSYSSVAGYPVGYSGYPHVGYAGAAYPGAYPAGVAPLAYSAGVAPVAYTAGVAAPVAYPFGYSGVYPGYTGYTGAVHTAEIVAKSRSKRAAVFPASTAPLAHYTAPIAYTAGAHYAAPVAYTGAAYNGAAYNGAAYHAAAFAAPIASPLAYSAVYPAGYKSYQTPFAYGYNSPVVY